MACNQEEDACADIDCGANGECVDGTCDCDEGFEGETCTDAVRDKFIGQFGMTDIVCGVNNGSSGNSGNIGPDGLGQTQIVISNFGGWGCTGVPIVVEATVNGNTLTVTPNQTFCGGSLTITDGTGVFEAGSPYDELTITYTCIHLGTTKTCTTVYTIF